MRGSFRLDMESAEGFGSCVLTTQHHLDADDPLRADLTRPINDPHAASPQLVNDLVIVKAAGRRSGFVRRVIRESGRHRSDSRSQNPPDSRPRDRGLPVRGIRSCPIRTETERRTMSALPQHPAEPVFHSESPCRSL